MRPPWHSTALLLFRMSAFHAFIVLYNTQLHAMKRLTPWLSASVALYAVSAFTYLTTELLFITDAIFLLAPFRAENRDACLVLIELYDFRRYADYLWLVLVALHKVHEDYIYLTNEYYARDALPNTRRSLLFNFIISRSSSKAERATSPFFIPFATTFTELQLSFHAKITDDCSASGTPIDASMIQN